MGRIFFLFIFFIFFSCTKQIRVESAPVNNNNLFEFISSLKMPDNLDFCGEKVPLDIPEVRERAEREFYMLLQQPGQIILYLKRSGKYFELFDNLLKQNNLPGDLKYLCVAESALFMARSSKGAEGLWQFIPETGRKMGLRIDEFVDERRHPEKSTIAAIKYLKEGYDTFHSWTLTAAGYNMGHSGVSSSLRFQSADDYFSLFLNEETSRYIFRIILIKEIMLNAEKYGFKIKESEKYSTVKAKIISWNRSIPDLSDWAKQLGYTYKDIRLLNLWILQKSLPMPKGRQYEIAVPEK